MEQLCLLLFLLSSTVHLAACLAGKRRWRAASKPLLLLTLLLWYCAAATRVQPFIAAGLALSLAGDVLLMIPGLFRAGGMAFFGAHLCYIAAFLGGASLRKPLWLLAAPVYAAAVGAVLRTVRGGMPHRLFPLAATYMCALGLMSFSALLRFVSEPGAAPYAFLGSLLFCVSDSLIALREFRRDLPLPKPNFLVMATYIPAQFLIALGMSR